ncbi:MAG: hypothetical protein GY870_01565, partial [archaeon]|nr:hypothetical protein [archaeon]
KRSIERFSLNLEVTNIFNDIFGIETHYLDITENHNEALFFVRIQELIKSIIKNPSTKNYTKITVERMVHTLKDKIKSFEETSQTLERCIALLGDIEQDKSITISRYTLVNSWGLQNILAQKLMNFWENRIYIEDIEDEEIPILENDALLKYKKCMKLKLEPNLINFLTLGFNFQESKKILSILKKIGKIDTISYHLPSTDYKTYDNLQDMVIISKGRTIYIRSRTSTHDQVTMFSGLIQTIEIVRNNYMSDKTAGIQDWFQFEKVDFLDFGNLHAILGNGDNENKVILRFRERPQKLYIEKTTAFIKEFEKIFAEILTNRIINVKEIRPEITKLFYIHFNPFPQKAAFDKIVGLIDKEIEKSEKWDSLTDIEKDVVELILKSHNLKINAILSNFAEKNLNNISESDILQIVFDLINEKILG